MKNKCEICKKACAVRFCVECSQKIIKKVNERIPELRRAVIKELILESELDTSVPGFPY
jgi:hypothetical protein